MADIRLITILPPQTVPGVQAAQVTPSTTSNATPTVATFPPGTILSGFIVNRDATGNPILRTDSGDVVFSSQFFLKIGSEVSIRIELTGGQPLAHLLTVDGQPPEIAEKQSAFASDPEVIVSQKFAPAAAETPNAAPPTLTVTGTLISTPPTAPGAPPPALPAGSQLTLKLVTFTLPNTAPEPTPAQPATPAPANPVSYATYARASGIPTPLSELTALATATPVAGAAAPPETLVAGKLATPVPLAPAPTATPAIATPSPPSPSAPQTTVPITATVIGNEPTGEALLQTPLGVVRLQPGTVIPSGSTIVFELEQTLPPAVALPPVNSAVPLPLAPITELAQQWTALQQIFGLLGGRETSTGLTTTPQQNPSGAALTPQSLSAGLMSFAAALKGGDFKSWLGNTAARWLSDQGQDALVKKAEGEFMAMSRQFTEVQPHQWQPLFFPVAVDGILQQVRLFVKRDRKEDKNGQPDKKKEDTRFVLEVDLSQLGEMQLDGFVRRDDKNVQFDLMIRSLIPLPQEFQQDIFAIYNSTAELSGYKGSLVFQSMREFPVNPMEDIVAAGLGNVTV